MTRSEILDTAKSMVCGQRERDYGSVEDNFWKIARYWNCYLDTLTHDLNAKDVAIMMCLFKIARLDTGKGTPDTWIDLAGYAACGGELATEPFTQYDEEDEDEESN